jgi:hypothetical protein
MKWCWGARAPGLAWDSNNLAALYKAQGRLGPMQSHYICAPTEFLKARLDQTIPRLPCNLALLYAALGRVTEAAQYVDCVI